MKKFTRLHLKELLLLMLPILGIVIYGVYVVAQRKQESVRLTVNETQLKFGGSIIPLKNGKPQKPVKRFFTLVAFLGHEGEKPSWWGERVYMDTRVHFETANILFNDSDMYDSVQYDAKTGRYYFLFRTGLPIKPEFQENATCHISVVARTQDSPPIVLGRVYFSKPLKELLTNSKQPNLENHPPFSRPPFPILPRRNERSEPAPH